MYLMNKDVPVLWFDPEEYLISIINPQMLPYALKDNLLDSTQITSINQGIKNYDKLRFFFADRVLVISRENAKAILQSINNTQKLTEEESYRLSLSCRGISTNDCFWVKNDEENISFKDIDIRARHLSDVVFQISMKGTPVSIEHSLLDADISTKGFFKKTWVHENGEFVLYKSDSTTTNINTKSEVLVSNYLKDSNVKHVEYELVEKEGLLCCKCKCATNDKISFVEADYIKSYLERNNINFLDYIKKHFRTDFANMVVCDYLFGDTDEHVNNWGFEIDVDTNEIIGLFPKFDHNQAMIIFETHKEKEFDELTYDPTNKSMLESVKEWYPYSNLNLNTEKLPQFLKDRLISIEKIVNTNLEEDQKSLNAISCKNKII